MVRHRQPTEIKRRIPRQERAGETVSVILEAAAQVLEAGGLAGFTTTDDSGKFVLEKRFAGQKLSFDCHEGGFLTRVCQPN